MAVQRIDENALAFAIRRGAGKVYDNPHLWGALQIRAARDMHDAIVEQVLEELARSNGSRFFERGFRGAAGTDPNSPATYHKGNVTNELRYTKGGVDYEV